MIALVDALTERKEVKNLLEETQNAEEPWKRFIDNQKWIEIAHGTGYNGQEKHIVLWYIAIQDVFDRRTIDLEYCCSDENDADVMTK